MPAPAKISHATPVSAPAPGGAAPADTFHTQILVVLADVRYLNWTFHVGTDPEPAGAAPRHWLQVRFPGADSVTGDPAVQHGRKWRLSPYMTKSELVQTAFKAVLTAIEHETREQFAYRGRPIFGPHFNVDELWAALAHAPDTRHAL